MVVQALDDWSVDGPLFKHAIMQAKLAKQSSKLGRDSVASR